MPSPTIASTKHQREVSTIVVATSGGIAPALFITTTNMKPSRKSGSGDLLVAEAV